MLSTLLPIVTEVKLRQLRKALTPILVTLLGIVIEVKAQLAKATSPILMTLFGILIEVKPLQPEKAISPMLATYVVNLITPCLVFRSKSLEIIVGKELG